MNIRGLKLLRQKHLNMCEFCTEGSGKMVKDHHITKKDDPGYNVGSGPV